MNTNAIQLVNVTKSYSKLTAVNKINLTVDQKEVVAILGPNGAGKSTLMKLISGFLAPNEGEIKIFEQDLNSNMLKLQKKIGYMPENNPLYSHMSVYESIFSSASLQGLRRSEIKEKMHFAISATGLKEVIHKPIANLSKGFKQRVGLAQVLVHDPEILLLDEPTEGLDPNQRLEIRNVIKEIGKKRTVLISTHVMQEVEAMCTRVVIINKGKVIFDKSISATKAQMKKENLSLEELFRKLTTNGTKEK